MKACLAALGCLLLIQGGCRSQSGLVHKPDTPDRTVQSLLHDARAALPKNWTVTYEAEYRILEIQRNDPVLTHGPVVYNDSDVSGSKPPASNKPRMWFDVRPFLTPEARTAKYVALEGQMIAIEKKVSPRQGKEVMDRGLFAHTAAEKDLVEAHNRILEEQGALPEYHYGSIGLSCGWFDGTLAPFEGVVSETEREECLRVYRQFLGLLLRYELAPGERRRADSS